MQCFLKSRSNLSISYMGLYYSYIIMIKVHRYYGFCPKVLFQVLKFCLFSGNAGLLLITEYKTEKKRMFSPAEQKCII